MTRRVRAAAAAFALLLGSAPFDIAPLGAAITALTVSVDGSPLGPIAVDRGADGTQIALAPLVRALHWQLDRRQRSVQLSGDDRVVALTVGSRQIREDGDVAGTLKDPLAERAGAFYLGVPDAARLFALRVVRAGSALAFTHPPRLDQTATIDEDVPRPATPRPRPTPTPPRTGASSSTLLGGPSDAGRILVSFQRTAGVGSVQVTAESHGAFVQTYVDASGVGGFGTPNATVQLGTPQRGAAVGLMGDPLSGEIIGGGVFDGVDVRRLDLQRQYFIGHRLADGLTEVGVTDGDPLKGEDTFALLRDENGGGTDALIEHEKRWHHLWGDFIAEVMSTTHGAGIGFGARTTGRTFIESRVSLERGLPVGVNNQPVSVDVGRRLSDVTTLAGGVGTGGSGGLSPFLGLSSRAGDVSATLSYANRALSTSVTAQTPTGSVQVFRTGGVDSTFGLSGSFALRNASLDLTGTSGDGQRDATVAVRTNGAIGVIAGLGLDGRRVGPIVGLAFPLTRFLAIQGTIQTAAAGGESTRLSLALRVPRAAPRRPRTIAATVHVTGAPSGAVLRYLVDGAPVRGTATGVPGAQRLDVIPGTHVFSVESVDGAVGSPQVTATLAAAGDVELPLWRQRTISGRVRLADAQSVASDTSLSGIIVTIAPGDASAATDADGRFFFGRQPFPPDAVLAVDPDTLPSELRAPAPAPLSDTEMDVALQSLTIDEHTFSTGKPARKPAHGNAKPKRTSSSSSPSPALFSAANVLGVGRAR